MISSHKRLYLVWKNRYDVGQPVRVIINDEPVNTVTTSKPFSKDGRYYIRLREVVGNVPLVALKVI